MTTTEQITRNIVQDIIEGRSEFITDIRSIAWYLGELDITETVHDLAFTQLCDHFGFAR